MEGERIVLESSCKEHGKVTKVFASPSNKRYIIGYESGFLELRDSVNFEIT